MLNNKYQAFQIPDWNFDLPPSQFTRQSTSPVSSGAEQFPAVLGPECWSKWPQTWMNLEERHQDLMLPVKGQIYVSNAQSFHILPTCSTWKNICLETQEEIHIFCHRGTFCFSPSQNCRVHNSLVIKFQNMLCAETWQFYCPRRGFLAARWNHKDHCSQPHLSLAAAIPPTSTSLAHLRYMKLVPAVAGLNSSSFLGMFHCFTHRVFLKTIQPFLKSNKTAPQLW